MSVEDWTQRDTIDSREVIDRIAELRAGDTDTWQWVRDELTALEMLADAGDSTPDWLYGVTLVRDSYFTDYARELADEMVDADGKQMSAAQWPFDCIDWERAARELKVDYIDLDLAGTTFWARA